MNLTEGRELCGSWVEEDGVSSCEEDYDEGCPFHAECQADAEVEPKA